MPTRRSLDFGQFSADFRDVLALFDCAFDGFALWERDPWRVAHANPAFWQLFCAPNEAAGSKSTPTALPDRFLAQAASLLDRFNGGAGSENGLTARLDIGTEGKAVGVRLCRIAVDDKPLVAMIVRASAGEPSVRDSDSLRRDPLTGLPDREFLMQRVATLLGGERTADRQFALIFLDLDDFKSVNDEFGHLFGDDVLREAARRIAGCLRDGDHIVRYGGDEFVALVEGVSAADEVKPVIGRIHMALAKPIAIPGGEVSLSLSAGMALASEAGGSPEKLLAAADRAMYAAKRTVV